MTLAPGLEHTITRVVDEGMSPTHLLPTVVLATPKMIEFMEQVCLELADPHLEDGQTTVGTHVDVSHESAAREGEEVRFLGRLSEIDGRRLTFSVSAQVGERIIGKGTHQRFVVERSRFRS